MDDYIGSPVAYGQDTDRWKGLLESEPELSPVSTKTPCESPFRVATLISPEAAPPESVSPMVATYAHWLTSLSKSTAYTPIPSREAPTALLLPRTSVPFDATTAKFARP
jgi:hypothetical protein